MTTLTPEQKAALDAVQGKPLTVQIDDSLGDEFEIEDMETGEKVRFPVSLLRRGE